MLSDLAVAGGRWQGDDEPASGHLMTGAEVALSGSDARMPVSLTGRARVRSQWS
ncbi:hypothetical protein JDY09_00275 [Thermoleophilum album]|nr:hypothetical protein JDY09_00275 [Thermoleophilum album]